MFGLSASMLALAAIAVLASGAAVAFALRRYSHSRRITMFEFTTCSALFVAVLLPGISWAGGTIAQNGAVGGYQEFWNGSIIAAKYKEISCTRDGSCVRTYNCDPYQELETYTVQIPYTTTETTTVNGKTTTRTVTKYRSETRTRWVTKYHSCPYATHEYTYWLEDSFGESHAVASNIFALDARAWRRNTSLPASIERGMPGQWQTAKTSIDAGDLPPATKLNEYTNYLLASQSSILSAYSDKVEFYKKARLLPYHTANLTSNPIRSGYNADKMVFAGMESDRYDEWQQSLGRLNSYLGNELQGDLHVLTVPASKIENPDDYTAALMAYWQSRELGKFGLAKNAIMLVVGVSDDGHMVMWSRAKTGVPEGNGEMLSALSNRLKGTPFEPRSLLGWPVAQTRGDDLTFVPSAGIVEQTIMRDYPFKRPCMDCKDKDDNGSGYVYLESSAYISTGAQVGVAAVLFVVGLALFGLAAWFHLDLLWPAIQRRWKDRLFFTTIR